MQRTQNQPGGIDDIESSIHLSNVKFISRGTPENKTEGKKKTTAKAEKPSKKKKAKG